MSRKALCTSLGVAWILAAGAAAPSFAQQRESGPSATTGAPQGVLEEVIVTARRREENLQSVPISITVLSQDNLDRHRIQSLDDLQFFVPEMYVSNGGYRDNPIITIRGQGGFSPGSGPAVVAYLNEVPLLTDTTGATIGGSGLYYDLENIQVLKGPQGTLFGRSTTGGAVLMQTKRPTDRLEGDVRATIGNYSDREVDATLNVPILDDTLLFRLAVNAQTRDGFTFAQGTPGHANGLDLDDRDVLSGRATLSFRPSESIRNDLIVTGMHSETNGTSSILTLVNPDGFAALVFPDIGDILATQNDLGVRKQVPLDTDPYQERKYWNVTDIFEADLSSAILARAILSYSDTSSSVALDADGTSLPVFNFPVRTLEPVAGEQFTFEPQLQGRFGESTWVLGAYVEDMPTPDFAIVENVIFGGSSLSVGRDRNKSKAVYGQGTYDLSQHVQGLKLTAGYRYTWDDRFTQVKALEPDGSCISPPPNADATCTLTFEDKFSAPTWTLGVDYQMSERALLYLAARRGYRTGGFNRNVLSEENRTFAPEYVEDIELGAKTNWSSGTVRGHLNAAAFYDEYEDIQIPLTVNDVNGPVSITSNAAKARIVGGDIDAGINLSDRLYLAAQLSWLDFEYTEFAPGADSDLLNDQKTIGRPPFTYGLSAQYWLPVSSDLGDLSISAHWRWQDEQGDYRDPGGVVDAYGILNLAAEWNNIGGHPVDASVFMTNATDETYISSAYTLYYSLGLTGAIYGEPRMYGFRLRYRFNSSGVN